MNKKLIRCDPYQEYWKTCDEPETIQEDEDEQEFDEVFHKSGQIH